MLRDPDFVQSLSNFAAEPFEFRQRLRCLYVVNHACAGSALAVEREVEDAVVRAEQFARRERAFGHGRAERRALDFESRRVAAPARNRLKEHVTCGAYERV